MAALIAVVSCVAVGCADSHFRADAEDARRLELLHGDPLFTYLAAPADYEDNPAHYRSSSGEPLDFAAVEDGVVGCTKPTASAEDVLGVLAVAETAGWTPSVEGGSGGRFRLRKRFGEVWASAAADAGPAGLRVDFSIPPHTSTGFPPGPGEAAQGRTCLDAVKTAQAPPPDCPPHIP